MNEITLTAEDLEQLLHVMLTHNRPATFDCTNRRVVVLGPIQKHPTRTAHNGQPFQWQERLFTIKEGK